MKDTRLDNDSQSESTNRGAIPQAESAPDWGAGYVVAHNLVARMLSAHKRWLEAPSDDSAFMEFIDLRNEVIQAAQKGVA